MTPIIDLIAGPVLFFCMGLLAWFYRNSVEEDVEPFLLSMTLFAGIGTIVTLVDHGLAGQAIGLNLVALTIFSLLCVFGQIIIFRSQVGITRRHLYSVLQARIKIINDENEIENWTYIGLQIMKVDFFPEFYKRIFQVVGGDSLGPRYERKFKFIHLLPGDKFNKTDFEVTEIEVPPRRREGWWRVYFLLFALSWALYIIAVSQIS